MGQILVVDDDADVCQLMVRLFKRMGHQAQCATSGRAALECVRSHQPDVILLDVMMPEMSGIEVLKELRVNRKSAVPVIIFSALSDPQVRDEAIQLGASDYWVKSTMDIQDIIRGLGKFFPDAQQQAGAASPIST
jgi:CheY-like chemotaxis protein